MPCSMAASSSAKIPRKRAREAATVAETSTKAEPSKRSSDPAAAAADEDSRTVFVEGIPYESTEEALRGFFSGCGSTSEAAAASASGDESTGIVAIRMPRYQDTGRSMGYAHVVLESEEAAAKALGKDGSYLGKRFLSVVKANARRHGSGADGGLPSRSRPGSCSTLFVKNLPYTADEAALKHMFSRWGKVASIRVPRWSHTGNAKGFAYVQFLRGESASAVVAAAAEKPLELEGRSLQLDYDTGAPKASFKSSDGRQWSKTEGKQLKKKGVAAGGGGAAKVGGWAALESGKQAAADAAAAEGAEGGGADEGEDRAPRRRRRGRKGGE